MEKRIHLYVSKKHPALWLTGLIMLASVGARIAVYSRMEGVEIWRQIVWPSAAVILFVLTAFLAGEEMLHRTAVPVWLLGICQGWELYHVLAGKPLLFALTCVGILFFCGCLPIRKCWTIRRKPLNRIFRKVAFSGFLCYTGFR